MVNARERGSHETREESEGALMAKRAGRKGKLKRRKRETNAERAAREYERRTTLQTADHVAECIRLRRQKKEDLTFEDIEPIAWSDEELKKAGRLSLSESRYWRKVYAFLGQVFCEFHEDPATFLRLVADSLEAERPLSAKGNWYDRRITEAYKAAAVSSGQSFGVRSSIPRGVPENQFSLVPYFFMKPTFCEFSDIFRKENPTLKVEDSSLRRAAELRGCTFRPEKRGRKPKGK
jgi:hypothetical protein